MKYELLILQKTVSKGEVYFYLRSRDSKIVDGPIPMDVFLESVSTDLSQSAVMDRIIVSRPNSYMGIVLSTLDYHNQRKLVWYSVGAIKWDIDDEHNPVIVDEPSIRIATRPDSALGGLMTTYRSKSNSLVTVRTGPVDRRDSDYRFTITNGEYEPNSTKVDGVRFDDPEKFELYTMGIEPNGGPRKYMFDSKAVPPTMAYLLLKHHYGLVDNLSEWSDLNDLTRGMGPINIKPSVPYYVNKHCKTKVHQVVPENLALNQRRVTLMLDYTELLMKPSKGGSNIPTPYFVVDNLVLTPTQWAKYWKDNHLKKITGNHFN